MDLLIWIPEWALIALIAGVFLNGLALFRLSIYRQRLTEEQWRYIAGLERQVRSVGEVCVIHLAPRSLGDSSICWEYDGNNACSFTSKVPVEGDEK